MFRHMVAIFRSSLVPDNLLKQCSVLWVCADYDTSRVASCHGMSGTHDPFEDGNRMPKHVGVEKFGTYK
jgi:hypothetical protein